MKVLFALTCLLLMLALSGCSQPTIEGEYFYQKDLYLDPDNDTVADLTELPEDSEILQLERKDRIGLEEHSLRFSGNTVTTHYPNNPSKDFTQEYILNDPDRDGRMDIGYMLTETQGLAGYVIDSKTVTQMNLVYQKKTENAQ